MGCGVLLQDRYVQDERYFAIEHMDVRREVFRGTHMCLASPGNHYPPWLPTDNLSGSAVATSPLKCDRNLVKTSQSAES